MEPVRSLRDVGRGDLAVAGGKGANLGELMRAGFGVPEGFVVTTSAYETAVRAMSDPSTMDAAAARGAISGVSIPDDVRTAILAAYDRLGGGAVAVRSSATAEDLPGAAFAGQQETFLNVQGADAVLDAVRGCWASLWSDRAIAYRARRGVSEDVEIAVVVQSLVSADIAGVMFTADPVTGERERIVIDASPGLGEAVVSGLVTPEHIVLDAHDRVEEHRDGHADIVIRAAEGGGTFHDDTPVETRLTPPQLHALALAGRAIAAHFGAAQDIEWAFAGDVLWVLQARPLTALPPAPRRVNPLRRVMGSIIAELLPVRPYPLDMTTWTTRGHGRIFIRMLAEIPGLKLDLEKVLPEVDGVVAEFVPPEPRPSLRTLTAPVRAIRKARRFDTREWTRDPRFTAFERQIAQLRSLDVGALAWAELTGIPDRVLGSLDGFITLRIDYLPHAGLSLLRLRLRLAVVGAAREAGPLSRGARTRTADAATALAALARQIASDPAAVEAFRECEATEFVGVMRSDPRFAALREPVDRYLAEYGHREVRSAFLMSEPTWGEVPGLLYTGIDAYLDRPGGPAGTGDEIAAAAEGRVRARRWVQLTRSAPAILAAADAARSGIAFREDTHFHAMRGVPILRDALFEAGRRLAAAGALDDPQDVLHLRLGEIAALASPEAAGAGIRGIVHARKTRRESYAGAPLISPATLYPRPRGARDALVSGSPAGGGRATGPVRVVLGPDGFASLRAGEVLVCPYTNPSWTPLFERAAAVVVDTGGIASHAAIVAREYGIPAVMGTGAGTRLLRDGVVVRVDGDTGDVVAG